MDAKERARKFVLHYPLMFTEDKDFWIAALAQMILEAEMAQLQSDKEMTLAIIGPVKS